MNLELYKAAEEGAEADLKGIQANTPSNTPEAKSEEKANPEPEQTNVEAQKEEDTQTQEKEKEPESSDTYEKRYKDLQKVFTKNNQKLSQIENDNEKLKAYVQQAEAYFASVRNKTAEQPTEEEEAIPTKAHVVEMVQSLLAQERAKILQEADKKIAASKFEEYKFQYAKEVGKYAQELIESEPLLKAQIDAPDDTSLHEAMIKYAQTKLFGPEADKDELVDVDRFKQEMKAFASRKASTFKKLISNHEQAAMAQAAKANKPSMTSPGGKVPAASAPPKPPKFGTQAFQDWLATGLEEEQKAISARK